VAHASKGGGSERKAGGGMVGLVLSPRVSGGGGGGSRISHRHTGACTAPLKAPRRSGGGSGRLAHESVAREDDVVGAME
jgi:hypothetical protein